MEKEFDFSAYGKVNPYKVPDGFFEALPQQTLAMAKKRSASRKRITLVAVASLSAAASVALLVAWPLLTGPTAPANGPIALNNVPTTVVAVADSSKATPTAAKKDTVKVAPVAPPVAKTDTVTKVPAAVAPKENLDDLLANLSDDELMQLADNGDDDHFIND